MKRYAVIIIGAGFAGAATAYQLARRGVGPVLLVERETQPGVHASGKNASMARQFTLDPTIQPLTIAGTQFLYEPPAEVADQPLIRPIGSLIFFDPTRASDIERAVHSGHRMGLTTTLVRRAEWEARMPLLRGYDADRALWTPSDGVVDIHAYLTGLLRGAGHHGVQLVSNAPVQAIERRNNGIVVSTTQGDFVADVVVNAAGAWADQIGELAGAKSHGLQPLRRHLYVTEPMATVDRNCPFVWDDRVGFYMRPESAGLLLCACDETLVAPDTVADDPHVQELLYDKLSAYCPQLRDVRIAHQWSGLRTFTADRRFLVDWDEHVDNLFWVAGLGGHGVTAAAAVGACAADAIAKRVAKR